MSHFFRLADIPGASTGGSNGALKTVSFTRYRERRMISLPNGFLSGTLYLATGTLLLLNLDRVVQFDQNSGVKLKAWFTRKLGNSTLNRELWSVGTPSGFRSSRLAFRIVGVILLIVGLARVFLSLRSYLR